jgi:ATP-dependent Lhr-like helicase
VASFGIEDAGRWSLLLRTDSPDRNSSAVNTNDTDPPSARGRGPAGGGAVEQIARTLLNRYGVVFRRVLERESALPPWRELLRVYRRLEARGEIRGGRFVAGFSGEQYALPEAVGTLREVRRRQEPGGFVSLSAADPLNLVGIITPGQRLPALTANRVLYQDGIPIALLVAGEVRFLEKLEAASEWEAKNMLRRRPIPPPLRVYLE